jgi:hypothetical protein
MAPGPPWGVYLSNLNQTIPPIFALGKVQVAICIHSTESRLDVSKAAQSVAGKIVLPRAAPNIASGVTYKSRMVQE